MVNFDQYDSAFDYAIDKAAEEREKLKSINDQIRIELEKENKEFSDSMKGKILLMDSDSQVVILVVQYLQLEVQFLLVHQEFLFVEELLTKF